MKPIITQSIKIDFLENNIKYMDIDYDQLKASTNVIDCRQAAFYNTTNNPAQIFVDPDDLKHMNNLVENSKIPIPGFVDSMDDVSSESYYPHSDWQGPTGNSWIGK